MSLQVNGFDVDKGYGGIMDGYLYVGLEVVRPPAAIA
jgi:hypothetical protein